MNAMKGLKDMFGKAKKTTGTRNGGGLLRFAPAATAIAGGALLAAFPLLRPWGDKTGVAAEMADAFASPMWVAAHGAGMLGFLALAAAALAQGRGGARWWLAGGTALILPFFGAETFGLHGIAANAGPDVVAAAAEAVRGGAVQTTQFGIGLLSIAVGGVLLARRDRAASVLAFALATYLPQFFFGPEVRIAHGLVLLAGAAWWATSLTRDAQPGDVAARVLAGKPVASGALA
ncbi:hypothetical protein ACFORJ_04285 [Corynebacterium hansenii]|uniref:Uncharacterized protein n=1 Tax=Corynebacterium hansenii TaxID=394964 RepID=A0ABV7ZLI6_9CORY|nr:hypothetical protein [Corynebacterium hansenii]WJY98785.1 hypothetical protein CHAN_00720 [Corynebacterium hansenii]